MSLQSALNKISPLEDSVILELELIASHQFITKGDHLATEGRPFAFEVFVMNGLLRTYFKISDDREYNSNFYQNDQFISPHFSRTRVTNSLVNIQALEDTKVVLFEEKAFTQLRHKYPSLLQFGNYVAQQELVSKCRKEILMATTTAHERYEIFIIEFPYLINRLPLHHIAMYLGISPVSLSRIRSQKK